MPWKDSTDTWSSMKSSCWSQPVAMRAPQNVQRIQRQDEKFTNSTRSNWFNSSLFCVCQPLAMRASHKVQRRQRPYEKFTNWTRPIWFNSSLFCVRQCHEKYIVVEVNLWPWEPHRTCREDRGRKTSASPSANRVCKYKKSQQCNDEWWPIKIPEKNKIWHGGKAKSANLGRKN